MKVPSARDYFIPHVGKGVRRDPEPVVSPVFQSRILLPAVLLLLATAPAIVYALSDGAQADGDASSITIAQTLVRGGSGTTRSPRVEAAPPDSSIQHALAQVSATRIEHTIATLVGFGNRNTLSSMNKDLAPNEGVSAAAAWIEREFQSYSAACGGCLEVRQDTFTEPASTDPRGRIPRPTTISNVYAILKGSDPEQAARMYLVTGHYDSRGSDVLDTHKPAPGANDDASGVAVSLECARVLSGLRLPATLVFAAVAGEEQGLNGSTHLAHLARTEGWQLEAVLNNDIVGGDTTPGDRFQDKSIVRVFSEGIPAAARSEQIKAIAALGGESDSPSRELARTVTDVAATYFKVGKAISGRDALRKRESQGCLAGQLGGSFPCGHGPTGVSRQEGQPPQAALSSTQPPTRSGAAPFHPVLEFRRDRFHRGGDHTAFNQEGFAAVRFTEWRENFNHQHQDVRTENGVEYGDLLKFVDFNYVANVARLNAATLATLASAPAPPRDVKIENKDLNNDTTLNWHAANWQAVAQRLDSAKPSNLGYEVVWRPTTAPDWEFSRTVAPDSATISVTLPVSKDNVIFGVRSVDSAGHRSLVVVPTT